MYESPCPNGNNGVGSTELTSVRPPSGAARYIGWWPPGAAGSSIGSLPPGLTRPDRTPASARPPSWPGKNACTAAARPPATAPSAYGRPVIRTSTTGVPVSISPVSSSSCTPGSRRSTASQPSPEVPRPNSPASSPSTAMTASAARARSMASARPDRSSPRTSQPRA